MDAGFRPVGGDTDDAARAFRVIAGEVEGDAAAAAASIAEVVARRARSNTSPGNHPATSSGITFREQRGSGGRIGLDTDRAPWIRGAEYGASRAWVFGNVTTQDRLSRRQFGTHVRDDLGGYLVGKAWKSTQRQADELAADTMQDEMGRDFDRAGIRKR